MIQAVTSKKNGSHLKFNPEFDLIVHLQDFSTEETFIGDGIYQMEIPGN